MTHEDWVPIAVAFILGLLLIFSLFVLWGGHDKRLDVLEGKVFSLQAALNLGPEPQALVDEPITEPIPAVGVDTEPMVKIDVAAGLRASKPVPYRRTQRGRHSA